MMDSCLCSETRILAVDAGGTNCRFALFAVQRGDLRLLSESWLKTADVPDTDHLIEACAKCVGLHPRDADAFVVGLAGPVREDLSGKLTNAALRVDLSQAATRYGIRCCRVINDFMAEAWGCLSPVAATARQVLGPQGADPSTGNGPIGILGAGTGLGTASLVRDDAGNWQALPAEGGHAAFAFIGAVETAFATFAAQQLGRPYLNGDDTLTGRGLSLLHRFVCNDDLEPSAVAAAALGQPSQTLDMYARFYARMCRNWTLNTLCRGGLYVGGGIAARNPLVIGCEAFRNEFLNAPNFRELLENIPVFLITAKNNGLWGSARLGLKLAENGQRTRQSLLH